MTYDPNDAKSIFLQAAELPSATERAAFLEKTCAGKPELKARVESLLKTALDPDSLLDQPVAEFGATQIVPHDPSPVSLDFLEASGAAGSLGRLGGYEILEIIGRGGMGVVLRALDGKLNRVVAIKVLAHELASQPQARKRFLREAQAAAAVSHDHVVTIHAVDDGASGGSKVPLLVMECIVGQSLQEKIDKTGALGLKEILRIGMQIAAGLAAAHKQGLVHRDIKPANILLENGVERVKITDFGLARATDDVGVTQSGQIAGTPQYMSPEQAMGHSVDQRSDLFSLGSLFYTMCTGRPAFRADSAVAVLRRVCDDTPRPINEVNAEVPDWLIAIVNRLMAKKPQDRFQTAAEVAELLSQSLAHVAQPNQSPLLRLPDSASSSQNVRRPMAAHTAPRSRRLWKWGIIAALVVLCVWRFGPSIALTARNVAMIRLELQDPDAKFVLKQNGKEYGSHDSRGEWYVRPGTYEIEIQPRPGRRIDRVSYFHQTLMTGHFQPVYSTTPTELYVGRGDYVKLTATFQDAPLPDLGDAPGTLTLPTPDGKPFNRIEAAQRLTSDRAAAEWALSIRGTVRINDSKVVVKAASELPREPFRLTAVDLEDNPSVTTAGLACFADCRHLRSLRLSGPGLTTEGLEQFKHIGDLTHLNLGGPGLTDAGIQHFRTCRHLTHLTLTGPGLTDAGLAQVRELPQLVLLSLTGTHITNAGLIALHSAKLLRDLNMAGTDVTADGIDSLKLALPQCRIVWNGGVIEPTLQPSVAPFDAEQAKKHQEAWAKQLDQPVKYTNSIGMKLRLIPPGEFTQGTAPGAADRLTANPDWYFARWVRERRQAEGPPRVVRISQPMYVGEHEVTVGQFAEFLKDTKFKTEAETDSSGGYSWREGEWQRSATARWHNPGFLQTHDHPVSNIAWSDAVAFCDWLSRREGVEYRLPREAEWEYACRAGSTTLFSTGDDSASLEGFANIADAAVREHHSQMTWAARWNDGFAFTAPVGSFKPNNFGLFDMHGNVHEWCFDGYDTTANSQSPATDPVFHPTERGRHVYRGGGWDNWLGFCRSADRYGSHSELLRTEWAGFRVIQTFAKPKPQPAEAK